MYELILANICYLGINNKPFRVLLSKVCIFGDKSLRFWGIFIIFAKFCVLCFAVHGFFECRI